MAQMLVPHTPYEMRTNAYQGRSMSVAPVLGQKYGTMPYNPVAPDIFSSEDQQSNYRGSGVQTLADQELIRQRVKTEASNEQSISSPTFTEKKVRSLAEPSEHGERSIRLWESESKPNPLTNAAQHMLSPQRRQHALAGLLSESELGYPMPEIYNQHYINQYAFPKSLQVYRKP